MQITTNNRLRIAINAQIVSGGGIGGLETVLVGLIKSLGELADGSEEYVIIGPPYNYEWLRPYIGENQRLIPRSVKTVPPRQFSNTPSIIRPAVKYLNRLVGRLMYEEKNVAWPQIPVSDGYFESLGCDVIHFPYQDYVLCALPSVYNPHDLQHRHYPQFFKPKTIAWRESVYPSGCRLSTRVVVASSWIKKDVVRHYDISPEKIQVIPWAAPTEIHSAPSLADLDTVLAKYQITSPFMLYPAVTWPHKNHLRLLQALRKLYDDHAVDIDLVCTGFKNDYWPMVKEEITRLNLQVRVRFLGIVPSEDLRALYRAAKFVIVPTLFEAASGPVFEAWLEGSAVACSSVTSLPEQVKDAAILFDPYSIEEMAFAMFRLTKDDHLCQDLQRKGRMRLADFSWMRTAKAYRAVYRQIANRPLTDEDRLILGWDWMANERPS